MSDPEGLDRREFLKAAGVAGAGALVGSALPGRIAWSVHHPLSAPRVLGEEMEGE